MTVAEAQSLLPEVTEYLAHWARTGRIKHIELRIGLDVETDADRAVLDNIERVNATLVRPAVTVAELKTLLGEGANV